MLFSLKNYNSKLSNLMLYVKSKILKNMIIGYDNVGYMKFYLSSIDDIDVISNLTLKRVDKFSTIFNLNRYYVDWIDLNNIRHYGIILSFNRLSKYLDYFKEFDMNRIANVNFIPEKSSDVKDNYINLIYSASSGLLNQHYLYLINEMSLSDCLYYCFNKETIYSDFRLMFNMEHDEELTDLLNKIKSSVEWCFSFIFSRIKVKRVYDLTHLENKKCNLRCYFKRKASLFFNSMNLVIDFYIKMNIYSSEINNILLSSDEGIDLDLFANVKFLFYNEIGYLCIHLKNRNLYRCFRIKDKNILDMISSVFRSKYVMINRKKFVLL